MEEAGNCQIQVGEYYPGIPRCWCSNRPGSILIIIDDVLEEEPPWVESLIELFDGIKVMFVGVYCPLAELERRELERKNRRPGMARLQFEQVHAQALYDIEVDTSMLSPEECANRILACWKIPQRPTAFAQLKTRHPRETDT